MRSYKIFQAGEGSGHIILGVEFNFEGSTIDRHNLTFPADDTTAADIHRQIEDMLNAKIDGLLRARQLSHAFDGDLGVERIVVSQQVLFVPPASEVAAFPIEVVLSASAPLTADQDILYTVDGSDPSDLSAPYRLPVLLNGQATIKAAVFDLSRVVAGRVFAATYVPASIQKPKPITKAALLAAIPQADLSAAMANETTYRVIESFLINGPDPVAATQDAVARIKGFADQFLAATILSQAGYNALLAVVADSGWI